MPLLSRLASLWRNLFYRARKEQELTEELDAYLELLIEQKLNEGLEPAEARRAALIELGGKQQVKEQVREVRVGHQLETIWQDLRYALRMLRRNLGFASVAVLSLALGIGANTAIFSLIDTVLLKMLPVKNPEQLVFLERGDVPPGPQRSLSPAFFEQARAQRDTLAGVCTFVTHPRVNVALDGQAEVANAQRVTGGFFAVLGVNPLLGRTITEDDDKVPGAHPVVVISYRYWRRRFASDPAIVGKTISLNGSPFTIIGVTPPEFFGAVVGEAPDLWAPWMMLAQLSPGSSIEQYSNNPLYPVLARLKPEVSEQQARTLLTGLLRQTALEEIGIEIELWSPERQQALRQQNIALIPASRGFGGFASLRMRFSEPLRILMAVVGLILLIACANAANLSLARATARRKEIAVRLALGASRFRLIRQLLTESLLLAGLGGALGLLFAWWSSHFLLALVASGRNPVSLNVTLDARVLTFTVAASLLAAILFGLAPAWRATDVDLTPALKDSSRSAEGGARLGLGKSLVVMQVALSLSLLIGAGLFVRSLGKLYTLDAGFKKENILLVSTDARMIGYQGKQVAALHQRLLERFKTIPGVRSASLGWAGLLSENWIKNLGTLHVQGQPAPPGAPKRPHIVGVGPDYFETVGMTILRGRSFTARDFDRESSQAVIVNEAFARDYFGEADSIGQRFGYNEAGDSHEIVGVVKDTKHSSLRETTQGAFYTPGFGQRDMTFQLRTAADPTRIIAAVRQAAREIDANLPLYNIKTLATQVDESLAQERLISTLSSCFGLLSLLLAGIGLYGILAYAVSQRTREIGIRIALGAQPGAVLRMVLRQGLILTLLGVGFGLAASLGATRLLASQLFDITPTDPVAFIAVPILLLIVALLACFVPARRATKVDPLIALRNE
ncbi:MAG: ADOP family duplicated permease [Blastocatellia bacterium]